MPPRIDLLASPHWTDYELMDSGDGLKLERFGRYTFVRPEVQALWSRSLPPRQWQSAQAVFQPTGEESGGHWKFNQRIDEKWEMHYSLPQSRTEKNDIRFWAQTTPGRHLGVFPEGAANWDWMVEKILGSNSPVPKVLNLFGYTGIASLAAAAAGAQVTHVDASKKSVSWARENQALSRLEKKPIRWIVDDALKFVEREGRRGSKYEGILLDPPKFGRGPKGEVWEVYKSLPLLLQACRAILSETPLFMILTVYAVKLPAVHAYAALEEIVHGLGGTLECGELVTQDSSVGRLLSQAVYARWSA